MMQALATQHALLPLHTSVPPAGQSSSHLLLPLLSALARGDVRQAAQLKADLHHSLPYYDATRGQQIQQDAQEFFVHILALPSLVSSLNPYFRFTYQERRQCPAAACRGEWLSQGGRHYDSNMMTMYPGQQGRVIAASDILCIYSEWQLPGDNDPAICPLCQNSVHASTKITVLEPPLVLALHIAVFAQRHSSNQFDAERLEYVFDLRRSIDLQLVGHQYRLTAIVLHIGSLQGGHYLAYVRRGIQWWVCNDASVQEINILENPLPAGVIVYMVFYERQ
jgi:ubiquitin C-terminal hydrolase